jgi:hypothetical protein
MKGWKRGGISVSDSAREMRTPPVAQELEGGKAEVEASSFVRFETSFHV